MIQIASDLCFLFLFNKSIVFLECCCLLLVAQCWQQQCSSTGLIALAVFCPAHNQQPKKTICEWKCDLGPGLLSLGFK